eukprot:CFRG0336T1
MADSEADCESATQPTVHAPVCPTPKPTPNTRAKPHANMSDSDHEHGSKSLLTSEKPSSRPTIKPRPGCRPAHSTNLDGHDEDMNVHTKISPCQTYTPTSIHEKSSPISAIDRATQEQSKEYDKVGVPEEADERNYTSEPHVHTNAQQEASDIENFSNDEAIDISPTQNNLMEKDHGVDVLKKQHLYDHKKDKGKETTVESETYAEEKKLLPEEKKEKQSSTHVQFSPTIAVRPEKPKSFSPHPAIRPHPAVTKRPASMAVFGSRMHAEDSDDDKLRENKSVNSIRKALEASSSADELDKTRPVVPRKPGRKPVLGGATMHGAPQFNPFTAGGMPARPTRPKRVPADDHSAPIISHTGPQFNPFAAVGSVGLEKTGVSISPEGRDGATETARRSEPAVSSTTRKVGSRIAELQAKMSESLKQAEETRVAKKEEEAKAAVTDSGDLMPTSTIKMTRKPGKPTVGRGRRTPARTYNIYATNGTVQRIAYTSTNTAQEVVSLICDRMDVSASGLSSEDYELVEVRKGSGGGYSRENECESEDEVGDPDVQRVLDAHENVTSVRESWVSVDEARFVFAVKGETFNVEWPVTSMSNNKQDNTAEESQEESKLRGVSATENISDDTIAQVQDNPRQSNDSEATTDVADDEALEGAYTERETPSHDNENVQDVSESHQ